MLSAVAATILAAAFDPLFEEQNHVRDQEEEEVHQLSERCSQK